MARIFVSYSRADSLFVEQFVSLLEKAFPNHTIWYDEHIYGGRDWWQLILTEIDRCDLFIYLLSNDSLASPYCQAEWQEANRLQKPWLPVIVRPKTNIDQAPDDLRTAIHCIQWVDLSNGFKDAFANAKVYGAINELLRQSSTSPVPPLTPRPVRVPSVTTPPIPPKPDRRRLDPTVVVAIIGLISAVLVAAIGILPALLNNVKPSDTPVPTNVSVPTTQVAIAPTITPILLVPSFSPTLLSTSTHAPTLTPTSTLSPSNTPFPTVTKNSQWTAKTQVFNGVSMLLVPPGCFMMGSDPTIDSQARSNEQPQTQICFQQPFWIDQTAVTQAQFRQFNGSAAHSSYFSGDPRPVEQITWFAAKAYCEQQRGGRLPTEAEYEYAARGPDDLVYPWGNAFNGNDVVYYENSGLQTADVGSKPGGRSWVGALDMSGNVWEWTSSIYKPYPYDATDGREDNSDTNSERVLRSGSSLGNTPLDQRAASRGHIEPSSRTIYGGVRCVRSY